MMFGLSADFGPSAARSATEASDIAAMNESACFTKRYYFAAEAAFPAELSLPVFTRFW